MTPTVPDLHLCLCLPTGFSNNSGSSPQCVTRPSLINYELCATEPLHLRPRRQKEERKGEKREGGGEEGEQGEGMEQRRTDERR